MMRQFLEGLTAAAPGCPPTPGEADPAAVVPDLRPLAARPRSAGAHSPLTLAYVGDAVFDLYVRVHLIEHEGMTRKFQPAATALVRAATQSRMLSALEPVLTEEELNVVRQGRNANIGQVPKSASMSDYRRATGFECLLGHLLLERREDRLIELLQLAVLEGRKPPPPPAPLSPVVVVSPHEGE